MVVYIVTTYVNTPSTVQTIYGHISVTHVFSNSNMHGVNWGGKQQIILESKYNYKSMSRPVCML